MIVPSNWMFYDGQVLFDKPIYTNQKYPIPCCPPIVPRQNPTGVYRKVIELPDEWMVQDILLAQRHQAQRKQNCRRYSTCESSSLSADDLNVGGEHGSCNIILQQNSNMRSTSSSSVPYPSAVPSSSSSCYTILLHGIESACFVYWNGEMIGFCKDSRLPSEFSIPQHHFMDHVDEPTSATMNRNQHVLHLVVARWSDGTYLEDQDHWWMAGIHRSVELVRRPNNADILDYKIDRASHHGELKVQVKTRNRKEYITQRPRRFVTLWLFEDDQVVPTKFASCDSSTCTDYDESSNETPSVWNPSRSEIWADTKSIPGNMDVTEQTTTLCFQTTIVNPRCWTAETPNLYTLVIEQHEDAADEGLSAEEQQPNEIGSGTKFSKTRKRTTQVESCRVGFRTVGITKKGILHVNEKRVTICGINRHEHDPDYGKVVSLDRMKQDIVVLK